MAASYLVCNRQVQNIPYQVQIMEGEQAGTLYRDINPTGGKVDDILKIKSDNFIVTPIPECQK